MKKNLNLLQNAFSSDSFLMLNKKLLKEIGINPSIIISDLISKEKYFMYKNKMREDGYFFNTGENIEFDTTLSAIQQKRAIDILEEKGLLSIKLEGLPRRKFFKINHDKIISILQFPYCLGEEEEEEEEEEEKEKKKNSNNDTSITLTIDEERIIRTWNEFKKITDVTHVHNTQKNTKTIRDIKKYISRLQNGTMRQFEFSSEFLKKNDISKEMLTRRYKKKEIVKAIKILRFFYVEGYWPENKESLPKGLNTAIFNPKTGSSFFFLAMKYVIKNIEPKSLKEKKDSGYIFKGIREENGHYLFELKTGGTISLNPEVHREKIESIMEKII